MVAGLTAIHCRCLELLVRFPLSSSFVVASLLFLSFIVLRTLSLMDILTLVVINRDISILWTSLFLPVLLSFHSVILASRYFFCLVGSVDFCCAFLSLFWFSMCLLFYPSWCMRMPALWCDICWSACASLTVMDWLLGLVVAVVRYIASFLICWFYVSLLLSRM